jgi:ubiquinone/menaquinone biosynthesis C-methylase UbiE
MTGRFVTGSRVVDASASPNVEHIAVWNEILVPKFVRFRRVMAGAWDIHSRVAFAKHPARSGERVLDVGCGFGETSLELAQQVGASGSVLGIDICEPFLARARADAAAAGLAQARFEIADAQIERFAPEHDLCFSRFGTMFFQNPAAAMRNLRGAAKPGGRLMMLVWRSAGDNEWAALPKRVARAHLPPPPDEAPTCGPGPFSMADQDTVRAILGAAGWADVAFERIDAPMNVGDDVEQAIAFQLAIGPAGEIVREAGEEGASKRPAIEADLAARLRPHLEADGVRLSSSSWCVLARAY